MTKYLWRETLLAFVVVIGSLGLLGGVLGLISYPNKSLKDLPFLIGIALVYIVALLFLRKLGISETKFIEILKENGFVSEYKIDSKFIGFRISSFLGLRDDGILLEAHFSDRYWPVISDFLTGTGIGSRSLTFYFPFHTSSEFNHNIVKSGNIIEIGHGLYSSQDRGKIKSTDNDLKIIIDMCADIDFLVINRLQVGQGFILISTGPRNLAYGEFMKKNIPSVLKFIQAFRTYYGCQDDKWDKPIDMSNLKENIDALNKEFVHSLREKYKNK